MTLQVGGEVVNTLRIEELADDIRGLHVPDGSYVLQEELIQ